MTGEITHPYIYEHKSIVRPLILYIGVILGIDNILFTILISVFFPLTNIYPMKSVLYVQRKTMDSLDSNRQYPSNSETLISQLLTGYPKWLQSENDGF